MQAWRGRFGGPLRANQGDRPPACQGPAPRLAARRTASAVYNLLDAPRAGRRELRRYRAGAGALPPRPQPAHRRDRQRQVHRGGCAGAAFRRARLAGIGAYGGFPGAHLGDLRGSQGGGVCAPARLGGHPGRGRRTAPRARDLVRRKIARLRRQPADHGRVAQRHGAVSGRHPRPARTANAVLRQRATRDARRLRRRGRTRRPRSRGVRGVEDGQPRAGGTRTRRAGEAAPARSVELPAQGDRERRAQAGRRPGARTGAAGAPEHGASRRGGQHGLFGSLRRSRVRAGAGAHSGSTARGSAAHRPPAGSGARRSGGRGDRHRRGFIRRPRLPLAPGGQPGAPGGDRVAPGRARTAAAQVRRHRRRDSGVSRAGAQ